MRGVVRQHPLFHRCDDLRVMRQFRQWQRLANQPLAPRLVEETEQAYFVPVEAAHDRVRQRPTCCRHGLHPHRAG